MKAASGAASPEPRRLWKREPPAGDGQEIDDSSVREEAMGLCQKGEELASHLAASQQELRQGYETLDAKAKEVAAKERALEAERAALGEKEQRRAGWHFG